MTWTSLDLSQCSRSTYAFRSEPFFFGGDEIETANVDHDGCPERRACLVRTERWSNEFCPGVLLGRQPTDRATGLSIDRGHDDSGIERLYREALVTDVRHWTNEC